MEEKTLKEYGEKIKNELLSLDDVYSFVAALGGNPSPAMNGTFICDTICHNEQGEGSHKLYYYENSHGFHCYTNCDYFDIFELVIKVKKIREDIDMPLPHAINYIINYFNLPPFEEDFQSDDVLLQDWGILQRYSEIAQKKKEEEKIVEYKKFNNEILQYMPQPRLLDWEDEGITHDIIKKYNIRYNPSSQGIIIPHYDMDNNLIGIRERTLVKENEAKGKYKPAIINGKMFNHPLGFNFFNLNNSKENIKLVKKAIIGEGEKFCLLYESYFGKENDITVACCGSSLTSYQIDLLLGLGVEEIIVAFDKQFIAIGDAEWRKWTNKLKGFHSKYGGYVQISYMFDKKELLGYKMSPIDRGPDTFMQMFKERVRI